MKIRALHPHRAANFSAAACLLALTALSACQSKAKDTAKPDSTASAPAVATAVPEAPAAAQIPPSLLAAFKTLPAAMESANNAITEEKVSLGRQLYFDPRLSKNQDVSCNSCHNLDSYGVDNKPTSTGHKQQKGGRNSPTVYNAAGHFVQFWDGRAADVEAQAKGPVLNPVEMAMPNEAAVERVLKSIPEYVKAFKAAFPDAKEAVSYDNMAAAIGAFERKLVTPSRWDAFLSGKQDALTDPEKKGFLAFANAGCVSCHSGAYLGGAMYQKLGVVRPWPSDKDLGRADVTKSDADKLFFKVPSLRNIEKTAPYFHDGSVATLEEAIRLMGAHQLGRDLSEADVANIATWLKSLTGELPKDYIAQPVLPKSSPSTPKADPK